MRILFVLVLMAVAVFACLGPALSEAPSTGDVIHPQSVLAFAPEVDQPNLFVNDNATLMLNEVPATPIVCYDDQVEHWRMLGQNRSATAAGRAFRCGVHPGPAG